MSERHFGALSIAELRFLLVSRDVTAAEVAADCIDRIEATQDEINAFVAWDREATMSRARELDERRKAGEPLGRLHGIPIAVKDNYVTANLPTTAGSLVRHPLADAGQDAALVAALRAEGALIVGKTNMHEWAYGATNLVSASGPTVNPWDRGHITGGSSGGSGAALAARLVPAALGSDTGGSIRIPAAACGVSGLKPTYGKLSVAGVLPLAWSFDVAGPMARTAADLREMLAVLGDARGRPPRPRRSEFSRTPRIGLLQGLGLESTEIVAEVFAAAVGVLETLGGDVHPVKLDGVPTAFGAWKIILHAEAATFHAPLLDEQAVGYSPDVRVQIEAGRAITATDYLQAQRFRREFVAAVLRAGDEFDLLVMPTLPVCAPAAGLDLIDIAGQPVTAQDAMTRTAFLANFTGLPAVSIPCGFGSGGLPVGLTMMGRYHDEASLLAHAEAYQAATEWHLRTPELAA